MKVARFKPWRCAKCDYQMDSASSAFGDALPEIGDVSVCMNCAELYVLDLGKDGPAWRPITDNELISLPLEWKRKASAVQWAVREMQKRRKDK